MSDQISLFLQRHTDEIVRIWTEKVTADERVRSDARLSYAQLKDHVPHIVHELGYALASLSVEDAAWMVKGKEHGRQRWQQGYKLKEVMRELMLLRETILEHLDKSENVLNLHSVEDLARSYRRINLFLDEEIYKTIEGYLGTLPDTSQMVGSLN
ncbi:MAG: RsbRD N-terminal domain-containing protein [Pyrinomonadaceae bacterium]